MKAIVITEPITAEQLTVTKAPIPTITDGEVLVQVKSISINPVDVKTRAGKGIYGRLKEQLPLTLGWDIAGTVSDSRSDRFKVGDDVFGMVNFPGHGRAYAEYVAAQASHLALKPANLSHEDAAAATLAALTALQALVQHAKIKAGDRVLIHAAAGGVGHYAVQIAKHLGAYVIGTSSATNKDLVLSLGADEDIDHRSQKFEELVSDIDFVLDTVGGDNIDRSLEVIKPGGTLISIPTGLSEAVTEKAKAKNVNAYFILVQSNGDDMTTLAEWLEQGIIKSHVSKVFSFAEMSAAHEQVESGRTVGKVVVTV